MGYVEELRKLVGHRRLILCGSSVIIQNENNEVLLQQRTDPRGRWCFPGGLMELGESTQETARREVLEETALTVGALELVGVYSGADHLCRAANGDEWYVVDTVYTTTDYAGEPRIGDGESMALQWFAVDAVPDTLVETHKRILADFLRRMPGGKGEGR